MTQKTADRVELIDVGETALTFPRTLGTAERPNPVAEIHSYGSVPLRVGQAIGGIALALAPGLIFQGEGVLVSVIWSLMALPCAWNRLSRPYEVQISGSRLAFRSVFGHFDLDAAEICAVVTQTRLTNGSVRQVQIKHTHGMTVIDADSNLIAQRIGGLNPRVHPGTEEYDDTD